jgi:hypothetical protein
MEHTVATEHRMAPERGVLHREARLAPDRDTQLIDHR